jgi:hypothetical protein
MTLKPVFAAAVIFSVCSGTNFSSAQNGQIHLPPMVSQGPGASSVPVVTQTDQDRQRAYKLALERQEQIRRDTDKLAELTAELKEYIDKSDNTVLSAEMVNKAATIEKLAKNVKNKMKERY